MYLSDVDIKARLNETDANKKLAIECSIPAYPFEYDQIAPSSIDLRLSDTFWEYRKGTIDLGDEFCVDKTREKYWNKIQLRKDHFYVLKPGQCVLSRTYEKITIPRDCAGKIDSKSGANRLSLLVVLGDYCNPGYSGYYPLQIVNLGKHKIKIYPYISLCQLSLIKLTSPTEKEYDGNYQNDDGGPAKWWNDKQIKKLRKQYKGEALEKIIDEIMNNCTEDEKLVVLNKLRAFYIKNNKIHEDEFIKMFEASEKKASKMNDLTIKLVSGLTFVPIVVGFGKLIYDNSLNAGANINISFIILAVVILLTFVFYVLKVFIVRKLSEKIFYNPKK